MDQYQNTHLWPMYIKEIVNALHIGVRQNATTLAHMSHFFKNVNTRFETPVEQLILTTTINNTSHYNQILVDGGRLTWVVELNIFTYTLQSIASYEGQILMRMEQGGTYSMMMDVYFNFLAFMAKRIKVHEAIVHTNPFSMKPDLKHAMIPIIRAECVILRGYDNGANRTQRERYYRWLNLFQNSYLELRMELMRPHINKGIVDFSKYDIWDFDVDKTIAELGEIDKNGMEIYKC